MEFNKIVLVDETGLMDWAVAELQKYSRAEVDRYVDYPPTESELVSRIGGAECVFVSWYTQITADVIKKCPNLKYIGMCCSLYDEFSANVDIAYARKKNIEVNGVRDYGDEGVVEFILSELIRLLKGLGENQWKNKPVELTNRKIGIIGMGATGQMLAKTAQAFQMNVYYFDRNRKLEIEGAGVKYLPLAKLLSSCEIVSTHLPKNTQLLNKDLFSALGENKIFINTSLGVTFDVTSFLKWIERGNNFAIFDDCGVAVYGEEFKRRSQIITSEKVAGWTIEAIERLSNKVVENLKEYIGRKELSDK